MARLWHGSVIFPVAQVMYFRSNLTYELKYECKIVYDVSLGHMCNELWPRP